MRLLGKGRISRFKQKHANARKRLDAWIRTVEDADWSCLLDIQLTYRDTEFARGKNRYIFNIGGNEYRVVAQIVFSTNTVIIESAMTHAEYDKWCDRN